MCIRDSVITDKRNMIVAVPISSIVIKTDTSSVKKDYKKRTSASDDIKPENEEKFECVFVSKNGEAKLRVVKTGIQDDTNIEVISGLEEGDKIITGPYNVVSKTLNSGDKIQNKDKDKEEDKEASSED